jgi:hypothetical protein
MSQEREGDYSPVDKPTLPVAVRVAVRFHEEYEAAAKVFGWTTQEASARPWAEVPINQRMLMVHVIRKLVADGVITIPDQGRSAMAPNGRADDLNAS